MWHGNGAYNPPLLPQQNAKDELHLSPDVCTYLSNLKISQLCGKMQRKNVSAAALA